MKSLSSNLVLATLSTIGRKKMRWRREPSPTANTSILTLKKSKKAERSGRTGGGSTGTPTSTFPRAIDSRCFQTVGEWSTFLKSSLLTSIDISLSG
jgi:hypothetical protein